MFDEKIGTTIKPKGDPVLEELEKADAFDDGEVSNSGGRSIRTIFEPNTRGGDKSKGNSKSVRPTTE